MLSIPKHTCDSRFAQECIYMKTRHRQHNFPKQSWSNDCIRSISFLRGDICTERCNRPVWNRHWKKPPKINSHRCRNARHHVLNIFLRPSTSYLLPCPDCFLARQSGPYGAWSASKRLWNSVGSPFRFVFYRPKAVHMGTRRGVVASMPDWSAAARLLCRCA